MNKEIYNCKNQFELDFVSTWMYNLKKEKITKGLANIEINTTEMTVTLNEITK